jgi:hypothetical protein
MLRFNLARQRPTSAFSPSVLAHLSQGQRYQERRRCTPISLFDGMINSVDSTRKSLFRFHVFVTMALDICIDCVHYEAPNKLFGIRVLPTQQH